MKGRLSLPVSSWFCRCDLTLEEEGVHDDNFKIPTVARGGELSREQSVSKMFMSRYRVECRLRLELA